MSCYLNNLAPTKKRNLSKVWNAIFVQFLLTIHTFLRVIELAGIDPVVLSRAVMLLVQNGKARIVGNYCMWFRAE
jgi:hypothetical protein